MAKKQRKIDIVLYSTKLKEMLLLRFKTYDMRIADIVRDARELRMTTITKEKLSRYFNSDVPVTGYPTQEDILWLCARWGVKIKLNISLVEEFSDANGKEKANIILNSIGK
jgi:hypothetical protein